MTTAEAHPEQQLGLYAQLESLLGPVIGGAIREIAAVADFEISEKAAHPFVEFIHWINTKPAFIVKWRESPVTENRDYIRFMTVTDDVRAAYAAGCYHLSRVKQIEMSVNAVLSRYDFADQIPINGVAAFGRMRQLDFEYQSFVLAYRRCLDYLAWGLSTYFKAQQNSYRRLRKTLISASPTSVASALIAAYDRHSEKFKFVIGNERGKSTRDRISHYEFVQAATINVGIDGHRLVGGGEELKLADPADRRSLAEILTTRLVDLHACVSDLLATFRTAVTELETAKACNES